MLTASIALIVVFGMTGTDESCHKNKQNPELAILCCFVNQIINLEEPKMSLASPTTKELVETKNLLDMAGSFLDKDAEVKEFLANLEAIFNPTKESEMTPVGELEAYMEFVADEFDFIFESDAEAQESLDKLKQVFKPVD